MLGTDPENRPILEGTIYDPATERTVNGQVIRDPFPQNRIPLDRFDPVALNVQDLIPQPMNSAPTNNNIPVYDSPSIQTPFSVKIDHNISPKVKVSGYWSYLRLRSAIYDGYPSPITTERSSVQDSHTVRLSLDWTLSPNMILHLGAGILHLFFSDDVPDTNYDSEKELGLKGTYATIFPYFTGLNTAQGGMRDMGPTAQSHETFQKPTANASITWVKGNHTVKAGAEMRLEGYPVRISTPANGFFNFNAAETALPYLNTTNPQGGFIGFPYAELSFWAGLITGKLG